MARKLDSWRKHIESASSGGLHFVPKDRFDLASLKESVVPTGVQVYVVDVGGIRSVDMLMDSFASTMNFPDYFGRNWDALIDLMSDLSWEPSNGYVVVLENTDSLMLLSEKERSSLFRAMEAIVETWRRGEGEARPKKVTAFHFILVGGNQLWDYLPPVYRAKFCVHRD